MRRALRSAAVAAIASLALPTGTALAAQPDSSGMQTDEYSFAVNCGDFVAFVNGAATFRETAFYDSSGDVTRWMQFIRAPRDVWTNLSTKVSIVVRGEFQQTYTPDPTTGTVEVAIRGFRYLVNEAGVGVTVQEVGRIVYDDLDETTVVSQAGWHELADPETVEPQLCATLR